MASMPAAKLVYKEIASSAESTILQTVLNQEILRQSPLMAGFVEIGKDLFCFFIDN